MMRAGVSGHGIIVKDDEDEEEQEQAAHEEEEEEEEEEGGGGEGEGVPEEDGDEAPRARRAMRVMSKALEGKQCGVGLVLESWKPRGLAHALNLVTRTCEAVRVDQVCKGL
jgi:hypothetical protein